MDKAQKFLDRACALDYTPSCNALASIYQGGLQVKQDLKRAFGYYKIFL